MDFDKLALALIPRGTFLHFRLKENKYVYSIFKKVTDEGVYNFADYFVAGDIVFADDENTLMCTLDRVVSFRECNPEEIQQVRKLLYNKVQKVFVNNKLFKLKYPDYTVLTHKDEIVIYGGPSGIIRSLNLNGESIPYPEFSVVNSIYNPIKSAEDLYKVLLIVEKVFPDIVEEIKKCYLVHQNIDMNEFNPVYYNVDMKELNPQVRIKQKNMVFIDAEMKKLYEELVARDRVKNEEFNIGNQIIAAHPVEDRVIIDGDVGVDVEEDHNIHVGNGILDQIKVQENAIHAVNGVDNRIFKAKLDDNDRVRVGLDANFDEINDRIKREFLERYGLAPELKLGDPVKVRNSENDSWESKFFACKETLSTGEKKIKTTDGKLWNYIK